MIKCSLVISCLSSPVCCRGGKASETFRIKRTSDLMRIEIEWNFFRLGRQANGFAFPFAKGKFLGGGIGKSSSEASNSLNWIHPESQPSALMEREISRHGSDFEQEL